MNPKTVLKYAADQGAKFVSVRFTDLPGSWQHLTFPIAELGEDQFEDGFGFDASSIRGWGRSAASTNSGASLTGSRPSS